MGDLPVAFVAPRAEPGLEVRVNFGVLAGRDATAAEIDDLGARLLPLVGEVSIVAENRHELSLGAEAAVHQVRIEIADELVPPPGDYLEELKVQLVAAAEEWARACVADRRLTP